MPLTVGDLICPSNTMDISGSVMMTWGRVRPSGPWSTILWGSLARTFAPWAGCAVMTAGYASPAAELPARPKRIRPGPSSAHIALTECFSWVTLPGVIPPTVGV